MRGGNFTIKSKVKREVFGKIPNLKLHRISDDLISSQFLFKFQFNILNQNDSCVLVSLTDKLVRKQIVQIFIRNNKSETKSFPYCAWKIFNFYFIPNGT